MRRFVALVLSLTLGWGGLALAQGPLSGGVGDLTPQAKAAILMDAGTGQILYAKNASVPLPPASMTKLMTLSLALTALAQGKVTWNQMVPITEGAFQMGGSQIWLEPGEQISFGELVTAIAVGSANDASVAVGEYLAGSEANFVAQMNHQARILGMKATTFANPHGLHDPEHLVSAYDMALLGRYAIGVPRLLSLTQQWENKDLRDGKGGKLWLVSPNRLLRLYPGADGLKTGFTSQAGYCLTATAKRGNLRLISVVMGEPSAKGRNAESINLLNYGFNNFQVLALAARGQGFGSVKVNRGYPDTIGAVAGKDIAVLVRKTDGKPSISVSLPDAVIAPVRQGQELGKVSAFLGGKKAADFPLVAAGTVRKMSFAGAWATKFVQAIKVFPY